MGAEVIRLRPEVLRQALADFWAHLGVPSRDSEVVADSLVEADLRGIDTHGLALVPMYYRRIAEGLINPASLPVVVSQTETTAVMDAQNGLGQVAAARAMEQAIAKADACGLGAVAVRNSNHFGAAAFFAMKALEHDMIGIAVANTAPLMPPPGGAGSRIGNNPLAVALPAGTRPPIVLDMACSVAAIGKVLSASRRRESIPDGWGVDSDGRPTTDPGTVLEGGTILPVGGPKGFGLALTVEALSALLSGGAFADGVSSMRSLTKPNRCSHFFLVLKLEAFLPPAAFRTALDQLVAYLKDSRLAPGFDEVSMPGEGELRNRQERLRDGIPVSRAALEELFGLAADIGLCSVALGYLNDGLGVTG